MRAELVLMGRRVDMAPRTNRRTLVVLIYAGLAALMAGLWLADGWRISGVYMVFATTLANRLLLGGYNFGGLIKPFSGKAPARRVDPPPFIALGLRLYRPAPEEPEYRNDERELQQRDRAHYQAYQCVSMALVAIWFLSGVKAMEPRLMRFLPGSGEELLYGLSLAATVVALTLPQAILLWTEPDMEADAS